MGRKNKILPELKLRAVNEYLNGEGSMESITQKYGVIRKTFNMWLGKNRALGEIVFLDTKGNNRYTSHFKLP